jgi:hypothetical protein
LQQHGSCAEIFLGLQFDGNYWTIVRVPFFK